MELFGDNTGHISMNETIITLGTQTSEPLELVHISCTLKCIGLCYTCFCIKKLQQTSKTEKQEQEQIKPKAIDGLETPVFSAWHMEGTIVCLP